MASDQDKSADKDGALVLGIDHVMIDIPAGGQELAHAFYVGLLGLVEVGPPVVQDEGSFMWLAAGSQFIQFRTSADYSVSAVAHPGLLVGDLNALRAKLETAGYNLHQAGKAPSYRLRMHDPFGNRLEFIEIFGKADAER